MLQLHYVMHSLTSPFSNSKRFGVGVICIFRIANETSWSPDLIVIRMPWTPIPKLCVC